MVNIHVLFACIFFFFFRKYITPKILELAQKLHFTGIPTFRESSMEVFENGTLYFKELRWYYAGKYACVAENPGGVDITHVRIKVIFIGFASILR